MELVKKLLQTEHSREVDKAMETILNLALVSMVASVIVNTMTKLG